MRPAFGSHFGPILGQCFGHDSAFGERSQIISGVSLYIILLRIFLNRSGLRREPWRRHFVSLSWANGCQVGRVRNRWGETKMKVIRTKFSALEIVPTSDDKVLRPSLASQLPYNARIPQINFHTETHYSSCHPPWEMVELGVVEDSDRNVGSGRSGDCSYQLCSGDVLCVAMPGTWW